MLYIFVHIFTDDRRVLHDRFFNLKQSSDFAMETLGWNMTHNRR